MPGERAAAAKRMNEKCQVMESKEFIIHDFLFVDSLVGSESTGMEERRKSRADQELILFAYRERVKWLALPDSRLSSAFTLCSIPLSRMGDFKVDIEICIYGVRRLHVAEKPN